MRNNRIVISIFVVFLVVLTTSLCSCKPSESADVSSLSASSDISEKEEIEKAYRHELSFSLDVNPDEASETSIKEHIARLKTIDETGAVRQGVSFVGYNAHLSENGSLVVDGYLRNFSDSEIYNIECNITVINAETQDYVALDHFKFPENTFGSLKNKRSRPVRITFEADYVNVGNADLSSLSFSSEFTFSQK